MEIRTCRVCKIERPLNEFRTRISQRTRERIYYYECKPCLNERMRNSEESKKYNRDRVRQSRIDDPYKHRNWELKKRHKINNEIFNRKLEEQNGVCAICGGQSVNRDYLTVDHDHKCCDQDKSCGKCLRGLLCNLCNAGLGAFRDDLELLKKAIVYLDIVKPGEWR